jgi:phosphohistidine phosphatase
MNLYLLRHGIAVEPGTAGCELDADRPLTAKGERKLHLVADAMEHLEVTFDLILSSPYRRARATAEIVAGVLGLKKALEFTPLLEPGGSSRELIANLKSTRPAPENVLLVGHEPYLSSLVSLLISGETGVPVTMKKGGLCKLSIDSLTHGRCAVLEWLLTQRQLLLMA